MRIIWRGLGLSALIAGSLMLSNGVLRASDAPVVHIKTVVKDGAVRLQAEANGPFEYTTYRPSESLYVLDLSGVSTSDPAGARIVASDLVKSYRLVSYTTGDKPMVRVEILLSQGVNPQVERKDSQDVDLLVSRAASASSPANSAVEKPAVTPTAEKSNGTKAAIGSFESIRQVNLAQNGNQTEVNILGSGQLNYHVIRLINPDRLVLDFAGSHLGTATKHIASNLDPVREIRLAQFTPDTSRIVIDLRAAAAYNVSATGNQVTVSFGSAEQTSGAAKAAPAAEPANLISTKANSTEDVPAQIPSPVAVLPATITGSSSALASPLPAKQQQEAVAAMRLASDASGAAGSANASPSANAPAPIAGPSAASGPLAQAPSQGPAASTRYTGEPISVNLKNVDLLDFFRLIHEISGLNVVVDPNVKGTFTIVLDGVPWDQALDIVLKDNDLDKEIDGNVLRIVTKSTVRKEAEDSRDLQKAQMEAADVVTTTRVLNYAKATILVTTLKKFLSSRGDIIADDRTNTLIIRDVPGTLPVIDNLLRQLDRKSQQVEIEARVVAASRNFSRDIGTQFGIATANVSRSNIFGGTGAVGTSPVTRVFGNPNATPPTVGLPIPPVIVGATSSTPTSGSIPLMSNLGAAAPTSGISYSFSSPNFALDMIITAAESKGVGKLLSKPKLITQNNQKATVSQGTKIPVQTVVNNTVSVQFVDATLELDVTPQITADGNVYMDVTVTNDQVNNNVEVQGIPEIITQSANTKVTVDDGATVVIGGIIVTNQQTNVDQVPLFGSLPLVGNLFKHTTVSSTSQELLFFLTPRILPG
jgi:type IV pilus secretin PilQ/predicted competence protein